MTKEKDNIKQRIEIEFYDLDEKRIKDIARIFAHDLLRYARNGGDMENLTATKVYQLLEKLDKDEKDT